MALAIHRGSTFLFVELVSKKKMSYHDRDVADVLGNIKMKGGKFKIKIL